MTHIEQMIQDMCPNGVEFKALGEVATLSRGKVYSKEYLRDNAGEYPVYSSQTANNGELGRISTYDYDGKYLTWTTDGAYAGTVFRREGRFSITNVCGLISNVDKALSIDFLYYWLNKVAKGYVYQGMGNPKLMSNVMETIEIPLPPLEIQKKIVECLDKFSALAAELQAELQLRRKQYEYYRTQLLTPHSDCNSADNTDDRNWECQRYTKGIAKVYDWQWKTLGEVCEINRGVRVVRSELEQEGKYPVYQNSLTPLGYYDKCNYPANTTFIISAGAAGKVGFSDVDFWAADDCLCIECPEIISSKYLYYYMLDKQDFFLSQVRHASVPRMSRTVVENFKLPLPPLAEQARIVSILDKFEALTTSLSDGIPAEQAAQQKRYEYYRDLLLTFPRKAE